MNASNTLIFQINGTERARITANGISTTNISVSTINGMDIGTSGSGTSTMVPNWPDAIMCETSGFQIVVFNTVGDKSTNGRTYRFNMNNTVDYTISFASNGTYANQSNLNSYDCVSSAKSIATLYAEGRAFNLVGGGISGGTPTGAIMAFDLATCPTGWSEYTPARGRFLRGIDNGAGNDPSGTRVAGNVQADAFQGHWHDFWSQQNSTAGSTTGGYLTDYTNQSKNNYNKARDAASDGTNGTPRTATETRPKNVAVLYCRKN